RAASDLREHHRRVGSPKPRPRRPWHTATATLIKFAKRNRRGNEKAHGPCDPWASGLSGYRSIQAQLRPALAALLPRLLEPVTGDVQTPLDGADRRLELTAHLLERPAADVERHQRGPVHGLQLVEADPQLGLGLVADQLVERLVEGAGGVLQDLRLRAL